MKNENSDLAGPAPISPENQALAEKIYQRIKNYSWAPVVIHAIACELADFQDSLEVKHGIHPPRRTIQTQDNIVSIPL